MTKNRGESFTPSKIEPEILVGDLRSTLIANQAKWTVNKHLDDDDTVPHYSTGLTLEGLTHSDKVEGIDFEKVLNVPPSNPWLLARRVALGMLPREILNKDLIRRPPEPTDTAVEDQIKPLAESALPQQVDWRNRWGWPWITSIRDQNPCSACWAFAATALVESMVRIEHAVWCRRSEGDIHKGMGALCIDGGSHWTALHWISEHGIADLDCFPWDTSDIVDPPTLDRSGRSVWCSAPTAIGSVEDQKKWLDTVGPLVISFEVWLDFFAYGGGVYQRQATINGVPNRLVAGHAMLVVGYDDNQNYWIVKNSWGPGWGIGGYALVGYGECEIDTYAKIGLQGTNPDPWTKRRLHNGGLLESGKGAKYRNFEMLATGSHKIHQWWRDNSETGRWNFVPKLFADDVASYPAMIASTFNRNFECIYLTNAGRLHHWWFYQTSEHWNDGGIFGPNDADGVPGLIQSNYDSPGRLETVVRTADGRLNHWWRENAPYWRWNDAGRFAQNVAHSGPSLIQSHYGNKGNFELVCALDTGQMQLWWRANDHDAKWRQGAIFGENVDSPPCMIEASHGAGDETQVGNFELCVAVDGQVQHWWRNNHGDGAWRKSTSFGHDVQQVVGLLQGSFGFHLEVVILRTDGALQHYWRDGAGWHEGVVIASAPALKVSPRSLDFGRVKFGMVRRTTVRLQNTGGWVFKVDSITKTGDPEFMLSSDCGNAPEILPGDICRLRVTFMPLHEKAYNGTITIRTSDPRNLKFTIKLKGIGVRPNGPIP